MVEKFYPKIKIFGGTIFFLTLIFSSTFLRILINCAEESKYVTHVLPHYSFQHSIRFHKKIARMRMYTIWLITSRGKRRLPSRSATKHTITYYYCVYPLLACRALCHFKLLIHPKLFEYTILRVFGRLLLDKDLIENSVLIYLKFLYSLSSFVRLWTSYRVIALLVLRIDFDQSNYNILAHASCVNGEYNNSTVV